MGIFTLNRRSSSRDPMRESAAMTTVYLLEWNRKFEQFLRAKVGELEARVAAQQTRVSSQAETEARAIWAEELPLFAEAEDVAETVLPYQDGEGEYVDIEEVRPVVKTTNVMVATGDYLSLLGANPGHPPPRDEWAAGELAHTEEMLPAPELPQETALDAWQTELPDAVPEDYAWADLD